jgi:hypothetical protein
MKKLLSILLSALFLLLAACEDCEIISSETEPAVPLVDCPTLALNIGDPCDDANPDTTNDTVDANCICTGELVNNCTGNILVMRAEVVNNNLGDIFLERSEQAPLDQVNFTPIEPITGSAIQIGEFFPFQFSTHAPGQQRYYFGFQYENPGLNPLLLASTDGSFSPAYLPSELPYAAPVYHQGELYAIHVDFDAPTVNYQILRIDLSNGQVIPLFSGSVTVNSQVVNPAFFSVSNGADKLFFLAGTSLFEYSVSANSVTHVLLEPNPDPDMPVVYTGLEYRRSTNELLALRHRSAGDIIQSALFSISQDGTFAQDQLLDLNAYTLFSDSGILHSTAYDHCSDTYYLTTPVSLEQELFESYLVEVRLNNEMVVDKRFPGFLFGLEIQED